MISYIPHVTCGKCNKEVTDVQRLGDGRDRWVRVRCHKQEARIGFVDDPDARIVLWQEPPLGTQH